MRGLVRSPSASQTALPKARAPLAHSPYALRVLGVGHRAPVLEVVAVDDPGRAVLDAELALGLVGHDGDGAAALGARDVERHAAEAARRAPDEDDVARLDGMRRPPHQHPVRRRGAEQEAPRLLPGEALGLGQALVRLGAGELAVAAIVRLVAPDARALRQHRILAREHPGIVGAPPATVDDDLVTDRDVPHVLAHRPDDARAVAAARVEVLGLPRLLALADHVDRSAEGGPDIVEIDPRGHHVDQHLVRPDGGRGQDLALPRVPRLAEAALSHGVRVHLLGDEAEWRSLTEVVQVWHRGLRVSG